MAFTIPSAPFPFAPPRTIWGQAIRYCYVRTAIVPHKTGAERTRHYIAGFETTNDHQFALVAPHATEAEALQSAHELARIFSPPLEVRRLSRLLLFLFWLTLALGLLWELNHQQIHRAPAIRSTLTHSTFPHSQ